MAEALLELPVVPARTGPLPIPSRLRSRTPGGFPVIVPVPPAATASGAPVLPGVPTAPGARASAPAKEGRVPGPRDSAEALGSSAEAAEKAEAAEAAEAVEATAVAEAAPVAEVVAGTTVDHLTETYQAHYRSLLGLAALLLDDTASCEDVVQEAFIRVHAARNKVRDRGKTLAYLRQTVVNLSRSALRRRILGLKLLPKPMPDMASAEEGAYELLERDDLIKAMRGLQRRQREVLSLRYFSDMTESQVAEVLGISLGSVKAYGSRGIAALRVAMEAAQA